MSPETFAGNDHPTMGVELELALVGLDTMALRSAHDDVAAGLSGQVAGRVKPEFLRCYVELDTPACRTTGEVRDELSRTLADVESAAERAGVGLYWGGTHPFSRWRDQEMTPDPRYRELSEDYQEVVRRPVTFGLHVHVGVPSGDAAVAAMNRVSESLPLLLALSANSPFWQGRPTGLHSHRIDVLEGIPTGGLPPSLGGWGEYREIVETFIRSGFIKGPKELWWDVRPSPGIGTVEVRICDTPPDLSTALALTALIQCLVAEPGASRSEFARPSESRRLAIRQNRWLASRHGLEAQLADHATADPTPARDLARRAVDRLMPTAEDLGCPDDLARVAELATIPGGSERQLDVYAETCDLVEVVRRSVEAGRISSLCAAR